MKTVVVMTVLMTAMGVAGIAQSPDAAKTEVVGALKHFYQTYQTCNRAVMETLIVDDVLYRHTVGTVQQGKAEFFKGWRPMDNCNFDVLRVEPRSVRVYGETAIVFGDLVWKTKDGPLHSGKDIASQVFVKRNGRWLLASNVSAAIPDSNQERR